MTSERDPAEHRRSSAAVLAIEASQRCADLSAASPFHFQAREGTGVCIGCCTLALERDRRERGDQTALADRAASLERELLRLEKQALLLLDILPSELPSHGAQDDPLARAIHTIGCAFVATHGVVRRALSVTTEDCIPLVRALNGEGPDEVASGAARQTEAVAERAAWLELELLRLEKRALQLLGTAPSELAAHGAPDDPAVRAINVIDGTLALGHEAGEQGRGEASQT